ncbi:putative entry exclusion protein TrbK-alt [Qipengyuania zhejiangensis]|uniref:putative entry exclusion protein TrbK-alt n=1 Tax=Qipengyuania zhejiangensis TaxID=3077782 RepID=UPI002D7986AE|nr:putative entry exclusion protein TrbK-alt [Qipengyuania sp. Z2]
MRLFARIGAIGFVAVALTMTALQLREEPKPVPVEVTTVFEPDGDPLPLQLRACARMGQLALSSPDCHAAWAEKRRRFLGLKSGAENATEEGAAPASSPEPQPAKDQ